MKTFFYCLIIAVFWFPSAISVFACTSAIFTGKVTADGRPLLWKHRDTDDENNHIKYFNGKKYSFIALMNSEETDGTAWTGTNNVGFSIMNTASYNLKDDKDPLQDMEGVVMYKALSECKNLADFEKFLDDYPPPIGVEANFGVIDAEGGAAYYEVNNTRWTKVDANDAKTAPNGYLVYTNFSYTGRFNEGMGYVRYQTASEIIAKKASERNFTPQWIFNNLSRSFYHSLLGIDLKNEKFSPENALGWVVDQDFIPRKSTTASIVVQGVKPGENPEMTIMWTVLGYPPAGIAVPLWVKQGENQPKCMMRTDTSTHSEICDYAVELKHKSFPITRGNGNKYLFFKSLYNQSGSGYMQLLYPFENEIFDIYAKPVEKWRKSGIDRQELHLLQTKTENIIKEAYAKTHLL
ncbi:MAG: hypothetical protein LBS52_00820 [Dysgonamonadaceae bacterium]|jgi:hypothetical protein|nr:hypothetical protein [Dysgonamonadaceae bacterium]